MLDAPLQGAAGRLRVVFVCEGNTCRSPMAEVMARQVLGGDPSRFSSAGLSARAGQEAAAPARAAAGEMGLDLAAHRARPVTAVAWADVDWCIAVTRGQAARLRTAGLGRPGLRLGVLGAPGLDLAAGGPSPDCAEVADPWGADLDTYRAAAAQIRRLLEAWAPHLGARNRDEGTPP